MTRYRPFHPVRSIARPFVPSAQHDDEASQRRRDREHVALCLSQGGFPVFDLARPGVTLWPMRARRNAA